MGIITPAVQDQPLTSFGPGSEVRVTRVELPERERLRVNVQGICLGRKLRITTQGDPMIVAAAGTLLAVSRRLASGVFAETTTGS